MLVTAPETHAPQKVSSPPFELPPLEFTLYPTTWLEEKINECLDEEDVTGQRPKRYRELQHILVFYQKWVSYIVHGEVYESIGAVALKEVFDHQEVCDACKYNSEACKIY